jgi:pilus assembly protein CpaB
VLVTQVSEFGEKVTIVETLSENGRAVAITVNAETAAGGFVTPGDYVDVILTQGGGEGLRAVTILQNIRVIAVDQDANERSDAPQVSQHRDGRRHAAARGRRSRWRNGPAA